MRRFLPLVMASLLACSGEDVVFQYQLAVTGYPHDWPVYECRVALELSRGVSLVAVDSVTVSAGVTDTLTLTVPDQGDYTAIRRQQWRGRIATWEFDWSSYWAETLQVRVPGATRLQCFP